MAKRITIKDSLLRQQKKKKNQKTPTMMVPSTGTL